MKTVAAVAAGGALLPVALVAAVIVAVAGPSAACTPAGAVPVTHRGDVADTIWQTAVALDASPRATLAAFMAAIVESGMRNLDHGDRDSLGVFQQRPSQGWGAAGQVMDPAYAATAFLAGSTAAGSRAGGGNHGAMFYDRARPPSTSAGEIAQLVQRSAHPDRYDAVAGPARAAMAAAAARHPPRDVTGDVGDGQPERDATVEAVGRLRADNADQPPHADVQPVGCVTHPAPLVGVDGMVCPAPGATFTDTWGAPRPGGRRHKGADLFAGEGSPLYAVEAGTVRVGSNRLGGLTVHLAGQSGTGYYYAHLAGWPAGLRSGMGVAVGTVVGYMGRTGNARGTPPHLHFEVRPGGGEAVNPTGWLLAVCAGNPV